MTWQAGPTPIHQTQRLYSGKKQQYRDGGVDDRLVDTPYRYTLATEAALSNSAVCRCGFAHGLSPFVALT